MMDAASRQLHGESDDFSLVKEGDLVYRKSDGSLSRDSANAIPVGRAIGDGLYTVDDLDFLTLRERIDLAKWLVENVDCCDDTERAIDFISEQIHGTKGEAAAP